MADNEEKLGTTKQAGFTKPAATRSSSALGGLRLPATAVRSPLTPPPFRKESVETSAYDVRLKDLVVKDIERMEKQTSSPIPANFKGSGETISPSKVDPIVGYPPIHYSNYQKTSQADFDATKTITITSENLHKSHEAFKTVESIFSMNGILTVMNGVRQQPEPSASNPTGYRFPCTIKYKGIDYRISADDVGKYDHDYSRCFPLLFYLCHRSIYYLEQEGFQNQNPIAIYTALKDYFNGHAGKDMIRINRLINDYKADHNVPIQKDVIRLDNLYRELESSMEKKDARGAEDGAVHVNLSI
jgi:hypothetical protein